LTNEDKAGGRPEYAAYQAAGLHCSRESFLGGGQRAASFTDDFIGRTTNYKIAGYSIQFLGSNYICQVLID